MTKYDDGRLEDFWEFNLYLGDRFPLEIEAIVGSNLELVSAFQDSLLQRAVFQSQHDRVPLPCIAGLFPDKRPFNALIVLSLDRSIAESSVTSASKSTVVWASRSKSTSPSSKPASTLLWSR